MEKLIESEALSLSDQISNNADISWALNITFALTTLISNTFLAGAVTALAGWTTLYFVSCALLRSRSSEWHCRCVTTVHAMLVVLLSAWSIFVEGPWPLTDPAGPNTPLQNFTCIVSMGYFMFDFGWCIYFRTEGPLMLFHHVVSIVGNGVVLCRLINGTEIMAALFGTEITNPILQLRWYLRYEKVSTRLPVVAAIVDFTFIILFTIMRLGLGSLLLFHYLRHPRPDFVARSFAVTLYSISWVFWVGMVRYAIRKYGKPLGMWKDKRDAAGDMPNNGKVKSQ